MKISHFFLVSGPDPSISFADRWATTFKMIEMSNGGGFEGLWFAEHHFSDYAYCPNPTIALAAAAKAAPEMRLGTAVLVLPLWNPVRAAEDIALLDVISGGRVDVGIGRGYQPYEFDRLDADLSENRDVFGESLEIMLDAWTKEDWEHDGRHFQVPTTTVFPKSTQTPHPPIWMAATSPPSIRAALKRGYHVMTGTGAVVEELAQRDLFIDSVLDKLGRPRESVERSTARYVFCSTSEDEIEVAMKRSKLQTRVSRQLNTDIAPVKGRNTPVPYKGEPSDEEWRRRTIIGTPEMCVQRIRELAGAGITHIQGMFDFGGVNEAADLRSVRLFMDEVIPQIKSIDAHHEKVTEGSAGEYARRNHFESGI